MIDCNSCIFYDFQTSHILHFHLLLIFTLSLLNGRFLELVTS
jgi:hypothetical protein